MAPNTVFVQLFGKLMDTSKEQQLARLKEAFANNAFIKCEDLGKVMRSLGKNPTDDELKEVIAAIDVAGTGTIDFAQYYNYMAPKMEEDDAWEEYLEENFKIFDKNGDGFISAAELLEAATTLGGEITDEEVNAMLEEVDLDGDGKLSYEEFKKLMIE